ncbi:MerR family transcriptional regulator [Nonomuraea salmonea]|uniref:MerR family transcriptional regulator n=1 Tax=Nonomuraea salmonea TaxID=46181 RepID=UPI0036130ABD
MRIGELAERTGVSTRSLRYYEKNGLLHARRASNGYRTYTEDDVRLVSEIRALLQIGFTLEETRPFVDCCAVATAQGARAPSRSRSTSASSARSTRRSGCCSPGAPRWPPSSPSPAQVAS